MPPRNVRFNVEVERCGEDPESSGYLTLTEAAAILRSLKPGDAGVFNAVDGPGEGEI